MQVSAIVAPCSVRQLAPEAAAVGLGAPLCASVPTYRIRQYDLVSCLPLHISSHLLLFRFAHIRSSC